MWNGEMQMMNKNSEVIFAEERKAEIVKLINKKRTGLQKEFAVCSKKFPGQRILRIRKNFRHVHVKNFHIIF